MLSLARDRLQHAAHVFTCKTVGTTLFSFWQRQQWEIRPSIQCGCSIIQSCLLESCNCMLSLWDSSDFLCCLATQRNGQHHLSQTRALICPVLTPKKTLLTPCSLGLWFVNNWSFLLGICFKVSCSRSVYVGLFQKSSFPWSWSSTGQYTQKKAWFRIIQEVYCWERESLAGFANWSPSKLNKQKRSTDSGRVRSFSMACCIIKHSQEMHGRTGGCKPWFIIMRLNPRCTYFHQVTAEMVEIKTTMNHNSNIIIHSWNLRWLQTASTVYSSRQIHAQHRIKSISTLEKSALDTWTLDGKLHAGKSCARQSEVTLLGSLSAVM